MKRPGSRDETVETRQIPEDDFVAERTKLLGSSLSECEFNFNQSVEIQNELPQSKKSVYLVQSRESVQRPLLLASVMDSDFQAHLSSISALASQGAEFICSQVANAHRTHDPDIASGGSRDGFESVKGSNVLSFSVAEIGQIVAQAPTPSQVRLDVGDGRKLAEFALATGFTSVLGGSPLGILDLPVSLAVDSVHNWQYVERLVGAYEARNVDVLRAFKTVSESPIVPPSVAISQLVLNSLFAAEQGARHLLLIVASNLHLCQDVATVRVVKRLAGEYAERYGFNTEIYSGFQIWNGPYPSNESDVSAILVLGAITAALSGSHVVDVPTNGQIGPLSTLTSRDIIHMTKASLVIESMQKYPDSSALHLEESLIEAESRCLLDSLLNAGEGSLPSALESAVKSENLSIPVPGLVPSSKYAVPIRDNTGAVRFFNTASLPFSQEIKDFNKECVAKRVESGSWNYEYEAVLWDTSAGQFLTKSISELAFN